MKQNAGSLYVRPNQPVPTRSRLPEPTQPGDDQRAVGGAARAVQRASAVESPAAAPGRRRTQDGGSQEAEEIALEHSMPVDAFDWYPVDKAVGNVRNEGPHLIERISDPVL